VFACKGLFSHKLTHVQVKGEDAAARPPQASSPEPSPPPSLLGPVDLTKPYYLNRDPLEPELVHPANYGGRHQKDGSHTPTSPAWLSPADQDDGHMAAADESGPSGAATAAELGPGPPVDATAEDSPPLSVTTACLSRLVCQLLQSLVARLFF